MTRTKPAISQAREMSMEPRRADSCAAYATSKAKSARADGQHQRLEHIARGPVLHEGRDARVLRFGPGRERQRALLLEPGALAEADRADPLAHHEIMLEPPAAVLAGAHLAREPVLVSGQIHGGVLLPARIASAILARAARELMRVTSAANASPAQRRKSCPCTSTCGV